AALQADPSRTDSSIARDAKCDHKTVAARRREIQNSQTGNSNSQPTETDGKTAEEQVDVVLPKGTVALPPDIAKVVQQATDQANGQIMRERKARNEAADDVGEENNERTLLAPRHEVTIQHDEKNARWIIKQRNWPDEDDEIWIDDEDIHEFVDRLTTHLGY